MIEKFYATHTKHMIDASAVDIRRPRSGERTPKGDAKATRSKFGREVKAAPKD